jgi:sec-independent protein translocase protein TatC
METEIAPQVLKGMAEVEVEKEMSFLDHLEELRWHLVRALAGVVVFTIVAFIYTDFLFAEVILGPTKPGFWTYQMLCKFGTWVNGFIPNGSAIFKKTDMCIDKLDFILQNRTMGGQFTTHITICFVAGLIMAFPYVFWELWRFIKPGLHSQEKRLTRGAVLFVTILFVSGISFGYFVLTPLAVNFLVNYDISEVSRVTNNTDLGDYISFLTMLVLACGIMFELPALVLVAARAGLVSAKMMRQYRKHAFLIILVIAAILTPSPDIMSQIVMTIPIYALFEFSILLAATADRLRARRAES